MAPARCDSGPLPVGYHPDAPLVCEQQNITSLAYLTSGLATTQHFWRVRGVNSAGVAGPWLVARACQRCRRNAQRLVGGQELRGQAIVRARSAFPAAHYGAEGAQIDIPARHHAHDLAGARVA